ncbi:hypothetical protein BX661DRAFT_189121 [Kickxella alabastrina]|uniref:uncharacterized protein n=1 Tax=Kickxella alabastrina TaxID=61397 RepID=UPI002220E5F3|nr:uncharacterized protein BX661DRAFT_189121 [Kickxella alabastrina]KAI7820474.1 hypothetical protein BX661DRAFT_189121 [Kickxella alabastrina]
MLQVQSTLPANALTRIFEYLFWQGAPGHNTLSSLPTGHLSIVASLQVSHAWRKRAARFFYGTAAIIINDDDNDDPQIMEHHKNSSDSFIHCVRTNIQLILESGYAPKTFRLLVCMRAPSNATSIFRALEYSQFVGFEWPSIHTLYYYDPHLPKSPNKWSELEHDQAIIQISHVLTRSMPILRNICALSAMHDSFGLFVLEDLVSVRQHQLQKLEALAISTQMLLFVPKIQELPMDLTHLTIRAPQSRTVLQVPLTMAKSLKWLDIGPIAADSIWSSFFSGSEDVFESLYHLRLEFGQSPRHKQGRLRHQHTESGIIESVVGNIYPLFPKLHSLDVSTYPHNVARFLENFPRAQLRQLSIDKCPGTCDQLSLEPFTGLVFCRIDIAKKGLTGEVDKHSAEHWVCNTMSLKLPRLASLTVTTPTTDFDMEIGVPSGSTLTSLRYLTLDIGLRLDELEELLISLPLLTHLWVTVAEVPTKAHEYLSRKTRHKKYPHGGDKMFSKHRVISTSLEFLLVRMSKSLISGRRRNRALAKTAWLMARIPSILRFAIHPELEHEMQECVKQAAADATGPLDTGHLAKLQIVFI